MKFFTRTYGLARFSSAFSGISLRECVLRVRVQMWAVISLMLYFTFAPQSLYAQRFEINVDFSFRQNSYNFDESYENNHASAEKFSAILEKFAADSLQAPLVLEINAWASPEPGVCYNRKLTNQRSSSIREHITSKWNIPDSLVVCRSRGIAWDKLREGVAASDMQYRDEVLDILDNVPEERWAKVSPSDKYMTLVDSRQKHLMDLRGGRPYWYIYKNIFPQLRYTSQVFTYDKVLEPIAREVVFDNVYDKIDLPLPTFAAVSESQHSSNLDVQRSISFALKTNLLYDVLMTPNVELEIPIGRRWSVAGEWIFPWWVTGGNDYALQIISGQVEARYWFGDRAERAQLTGWFAGLYAGGGFYDLQWRGNGYQGEFYIAAGLSGGYAHTINKSGSLRMEYSLGVGYLSTDYSHYEGMEDNKFLVWQHDGRYTWFGPTKAEASLVWFINRKMGRGVK